jgi:hypothetical protein
MTTPSGSPDSGAAGGEPTQPFWVGPGPQGATPATGAGLGPAASQAPGFGDHLQRDHRTALHWTLGLVAAAVLAAGGAIAGLSLAGHSSSGTPGQASMANAQQEALLNSALSNAGSPGTLLTALGATAMGGANTQNGSQPGAANGPLCTRARRVARAAGREGLPRLARRIAIGADRCRLARHRVFAFFLLRGVDGQFTIQTKKGTKTLAYQRGVIQSVDAGKSLVVKASDGTTWTWNLISTTVVRDKQGKVSQSTLTTGTPVWVGGPVAGGAKDARLIVLRPPQPAQALPSPTPGS